MADNPLKWGNLRVYSEPQDFGRRRGVALWSTRADGSEWLASPLVFTEVTGLLIDQDRYTIPAASGGDEFLQATIDHAWSIGMRPAGFSDVPLQTAALKDHLQDMRALVFGSPQMILPKNFDPGLEMRGGAITPKR